MTQDAATDMTSGPVRLDLAEGIATLVLDNLANLNAASAAMMGRLTAALPSLRRWRVCAW